MAKKSAFSKLPTTFDICGQQWSIKASHDIECDGALGLCKFIQHEIRVRTEYQGEPIPLNNQFITLAHEIIHACLHTLGEEELNANEKFVDTMGQLLYQILKTMK